MKHFSGLKKVRALVILAAWGCSIIFIIGAPGEVKLVYSVKHARPEKLRIENVSLTSESCGVRQICDHVKFEARHLETNLAVQQRIEVEPGIFPFGVSVLHRQIWSRQRKYLNLYKAGDVYEAYLASNGRYYLSRGSYFPFAYLLACAIAWVMTNVILIIRARHKDS